MLYRTINSNIARRRILSVLIASVLLFLIYLTISGTTTVCFFKNSWNDGKTLPNVDSDENLKFHNTQKNIFFHETSCSSDGVIWINSRQACAIESAAHMNPNHNVYVLFTSQVGFRNSTDLPIIDALIKYPNIKFYYLNLTQYSINTPLKSWMATGALWSSDYVNSHTSDILRYLSLWKYGGTYLDLDIVMMKPLATIQKSNFAGAESNNFVAAGIINMEGEAGHKIADICVKDLLKNFNGKDWGNNGPGVITRVLQSLCDTKDVVKMIKYCKAFQVLPIESCYSIRWPEHKKFFNEEYLNETMGRLNDSLIAHVWNKHSARTPLAIDANVAYIHLARKFCPKVLSASNFF